MNSLPSYATPVRLNRHEFTKPHFNVDRFLIQSRKHVSWEDMKDDLHVYLKILQNSMIELINKDYADFVNLSSSLVGLRPVIGKTRENLAGVQEEFSGFSTQLRAADEQVVGLVSKKKELLRELSRSEARIKYLRNLRKLQENVVKTEDSISLNDADAVYRLAGILSLVEKLQRELSGDQGSSSTKAHSKVFEIASGRYCEILDGKLQTALAESDTGEVERLLLSYEAVGRRDKAIDVAVRQVFEPKLPRPKRVSKDVLMNNVVGSVLSSLHGNESILNASQSGGVLLVAAMFETLSRFINAHFGDVTIPVDAALFHSCYLCIASLSSKLEIPDLVLEGFNVRKALKSLTSQFNLSVYHRLLVQEARKVIEQAASAKGKKNTLTKEDLNAFTSVVKAQIENAWSDNAFLDDLLHETWQLTLEIANFYFDWASEKRIVEESAQIAQKVAMDGDKVQNGIGTAVSPDRSPFTSQFFVLGEVIGFLNWLKDGVTRQNGFIHNRLMSNESRSILTSDLTDLEFVVDASCHRTLEEMGEKLADSFGKSMAAVSEIPRQYRWTRKERPNVPSIYLEHAFGILDEFLAAARPVIKESDLNAILRPILERSLEVYMSNVKNVLVSVDKVSSSLSKLKKSATRATELNESADVLSDDDKIKLQLKIDIDRLSEELGKYPVEINLSSVFDLLSTPV